MKRYFIFTVLIFLLICAPSNALYHQQESLELVKASFFLTGNSLLSKLRAIDNVTELADFQTTDFQTIGDVQAAAKNITDCYKAIGYVMGIWDVYAGILWQGSEHISSNQLADVIRKYLEDNPEERHKPAAHLVMEAFTKAFPIKKEEG